MGIKDWIASALQLIWMTISYGPRIVYWLQSFFLPKARVIEGRSWAIPRLFQVILEGSTSTSSHKVKKSGIRAIVRYPRDIRHDSTLPDRMVANLRPMIRFRLTTPELQKSWAFWKSDLAHELLDGGKITEFVMFSAWRLVKKAFLIIHPREQCHIKMRGGTQDGRVKTDIRISIKAPGRLVILSEVKQPSVGQAHLPKIEAMAKGSIPTNFGRATLPDKFKDHEAIIAKVSAQSMSWYWPRTLVFRLLWKRIRDYIRSSRNGKWSPPM